MEKFTERFKGHWAKYLTHFPFEWWVTLSFKDLTNGKPGRSECTKAKLNTWTRKLIKEERIQIAYFCVINELNRIHLHLLMLGRNRHGKTLLDVPISRWKKAWKAQAKITPIYDITGVSKYFERNTILKNDNLSEIIFFNGNLLRKLQNANRVEIAKNKEKTKLIFNEIFHQAVQDKESVNKQVVDLINSFKN